MKHVLLYMTVIVMLLASCNKGTRRNATEQSQAPAAGLAGDQNKTRDEDLAVDTARTSTASAEVPPRNAPITHEDWDKKIIKTADVTLELKNYTSYNQQLHTSLKTYGAYIAAEEQNSSPERMANQLTIKVPVDQFENLMNSFSGEGVSVLQKKINTQDVTGAVVDTRSRMEAKKQVRDRYLLLLKQARNMKEILEVQAEVNSVQEDIESAAGRVGYLTHQSAYSTINLQYFQYLNGVAPVQSTGFLFQVKESFYTGMRAIGSLFIMLVSIWPLILVSLLVIAWFRRRKPVTGH
jgi:hypothetical protein